MNKKPKVALFYDWLNQWGGAERVLLDLIKIYPDAPVYTLVYDPRQTTWLPKNTKVIASFINSLPFSQKNPIYYTPLYALALEQFDFSGFDIVISSTTTIGHCLLTQPQTMYVCYFHNINRYLYQIPNRNPILKYLLSLYKKIDMIYKSRPDFILASSDNAKNRIELNYHRQSNVIKAGVDIARFSPQIYHQADKFFLVVSRLVPHKKIDIAIRACHQLGVKLLIVGSGREYYRLNRLKNEINAGSVKFLGKVSDKRLIQLYQSCYALICPQEEDYGLTPIEVQACGRPVIAYNKGGVTETVINQKTGILYQDSSVSGLIDAIKLSLRTDFNSAECQRNAKRFSRDIFMLNFKQQVESLWQKYKRQQPIIFS